MQVSARARLTSGWRLRRTHTHASDVNRADLNLQAISRDGLAFFTNGAGSQPAGNPPEAGTTGLLFGDNVPGAMTLQISATSVRFQFFDEGQNILYSQIVNTP